MHVCAEQCHCLQINRPWSHPCAARRAAWAGLTSYCTSQVFRSPSFPPLEVLLRLFSLLSVSGEVNFKSCLNCAGLAGRDTALARCPARPARLCPQSALPVRMVGGCPWQREDLGHPQGCRTANCGCHEGHQNQCHRSMSRQKSTGLAQSSCSFGSPSGPESRDTCQGGKWQAASAPPKECSKDGPFLCCQEAANSLYMTEDTAVPWEWGISGTPSHPSAFASLPCHP